MITVILDGVNDNVIKGKEIVIRDKNDINHIKNSFRVEIGEEIRAVDGENEYLLKIRELEKKEIKCDIIRVNKNMTFHSIEIDVAMGILKNDKMNLAIQKLTEIGIKRIIPYYSERCVVKLNEKKDKWDIISKEALKQCQGITFTKIDDPIHLSRIDFSGYDEIILPYEGNKDSKLRKILKDIKEPKKIIYIIGPEGGFSEKEIENLIEKGAQVVTLGERILRAETAAIVVGGILINEFM